jgi:hypothetical protein
MRILSIPLIAILLLLCLPACSAASASLSGEGVSPLAAIPPQPAASPTSAPQPDTATQPAPVDECVACHQNKDLLIEVAEPEKEVEAESSGTG